MMRKILIDIKWEISSENKSNQNCENLYLIYPKDEVEKGNLYHYYEDEKLPLQVLFFDVEKLENNKDLIYNFVL